MRRLLALSIFLTLPAAAQTVTVDLRALDVVQRARPRLAAQLPLLLQLATPAPLPTPADPALVARSSDAVRALLADGAALLPLPVAEPPRQVRARKAPIELARFMVTPPARVAPNPASRVELVPPPALEAARLLLSFVPELDMPAPRMPVALRAAMTPELAAFAVFDRVAPLSVDLPRLAVASSLQFVAASAVLDEAGRATLDAIADQLEDETKRHARLLVSLRSDDDPDAARRLALARMGTVRAYLISRGIAPSRLDARASVTAQGDDSARIALLN